MYFNQQGKARVVDLVGGGRTANRFKPEVAGVIFSDSAPVPKH